MKYAFIEEQRTQHSVRRMCRLLEVSASGNGIEFLTPQAATRN
jgi:hypothetical protein